nr:hypothetical protein [Kocuria sp.]
MHLPGLGALADDERGVALGVAGLVSHHGHGLGHGLIHLHGRVHLLGDFGDHAPTGGHRGLLLLGSLGAALRGGHRSCPFVVGVGAGLGLPHLLTCLAYRTLDTNSNQKGRNPALVFVNICGRLTDSITAQSTIIALLFCISREGDYRISTASSLLDGRRTTAR